MDEPILKVHWEIFKAHVVVSLVQNSIEYLEQFLENAKGINDNET